MTLLFWQNIIDTTGIQHVEKPVLVFQKTLSPGFGEHMSKEVFKKLGNL